MATIEKGKVEPCLKCKSCELALKNQHPDIRELNAGSEEGNVDGMRRLLQDLKISPRYNTKVFILDEIHLSSSAGKSVLLKPIEEPPKHVLWCLCTTDPDKLPKALLTRCVKLFFTYPTMMECSRKLWKVCKKEFENDISEKIKPFIKSIALNSNCQMRDSYSILEKLGAIVKANPDISNTELKKQLGNVVTNLNDLITPTIRFITHTLLERYSLPLTLANELNQSRLSEFLNILVKHAHYASLYYALKKENKLNEMNKKMFYGINAVRFDKALEDVYTRLEGLGITAEQIFTRSISLTTSILEAINKNRQGLLLPYQSVLYGIDKYITHLGKE